MDYPWIGTLIILAAASIVAVIIVETPAIREWRARRKWRKDNYGS